MSVGVCDPHCWEVAPRVLQRRVFTYQQVHEEYSMFRQNCFAKFRVDLQISQEIRSRTNTKKSKNISKFRGFSQKKTYPYHYSINYILKISLYFNPCRSWYFRLFSFYLSGGFKEIILEIETVIFVRSWIIHKSFDIFREKKIKEPKNPKNGKR